MHYVQQGMPNFCKKQDVLIFSKQNISWKMEIKTGDFMSRKKRNMFGGVYTCIQCLYHIRGRKNNKVNYCSDEKERKIRGKGPPWHTLIIHNVLNMSCYITTSLPLLPHHLAHLFSELYQFTYGLIQTQQRPTSLIVIVTSSSNKFLRHVKVISRYEKDF